MAFSAKQKRKHLVICSGETNAPLLLQKRHYMDNHTDTNISQSGQYPPFSHRTTLGPLVHHILVPLSTYTPPRFSALVFMLTASEPAPGSDMDRAPMCSPARNDPTHRQSLAILHAISNSARVKRKRKKGKKSDNQGVATARGPC